MLRAAIADCRDKLPPKPRQALDSRLASGGGRDDLELAASVGMRLNTFLQNFTRARQLLADCLRKRGILIDQELGIVTPDEQALLIEEVAERVSPAVARRPALCTRRGTISIPKVAGAPSELARALRPLEAALDPDGLSTTRAPPSWLESGPDLRCATVRSMNELPPCGLYRTTSPIAGVDANRLVYFPTTTARPGPGIYLPESWRNNRASFAKNGITLSPGFDPRVLRGAATRGFLLGHRCILLLREEVRAVRARGVRPARLHLAPAARWVFVPELGAGGASRSPSAGTAVDDVTLANLVLLKLPERREEISMPRGMIVGLKRVRHDHPRGVRSEPRRGA